jgi:hypothetical protein
MVLTSVAWMQCPPEEAGATQVAAATAAAAAVDPPTVSEGTPRPADAAAAAVVSTSSNGTSSSTLQQQQQQQQQAALLELLSQRLRGLLDSLEPEDTCHCLWALSKLGALQFDLLAVATTHGLTSGWLHMLTAKPLISLLWVHAQAHLQQQQHQQGGAAAGAQQQPLVGQFVSAVVQEVSQPGFLATWTPQELSMLLWSCAVLGVPVALPSTLQQQQQQQQHTTVQPAQLPLPVLQEVCQLARQHVVQFTPQGVSMVCWSLAQLLTHTVTETHQQQQQQGRRPALAVLPQPLQQAVRSVFDAFAAAAAARLHYYKPQEVCNIFTACSRLQLLPLNLKQSVESYISTHTHLMGSRDVTDLLLAAAQLQKQRSAHGHLAHQQQRAGSGLGLVAIRALLHRVGQLLPELTGFQLAATAWACVRLAQLQNSGSSSSARAAGTSTGSILQDDCLVVAASLLQAFGSRTAGTIAVAAGAADISQVAGALGQDLVPGSSRDLKQAVALAWAIAATADSSSSSSSKCVPAQPAQQLEQGQRRPVLLTSVLQQLQQGLEACDGLALVQVMCVLARLLPVVLSQASSTDKQRQLSLLQQLQATAVARMLPLLPQLPAEEAVAAAWAAVKLQTGPAHACPPSTQAQGQRPEAAALLSAVLGYLHKQQKVVNLPGHSVTSLLWCCKVTGWVPPAAVYYELLGAADARLLQLAPHQQVVLLQAVAAVAAATGLSLQPPAGTGSQQLQQLQRRHLHIVQGAVEQLQMHMHQHAAQLEWELRHPAAGKSGSRGARQRPAVGSALDPQDLVSVAAVCAPLQLPQGYQLLQQVMDVWQMLQQQQAVSAQQALLMVWLLADVLPESPAKPWHTAVLDYQPQQYQHKPRHFPEQPKVLPLLLQQAVAALAADLAVSSTSQPGQVRSGQTVVLALRVFAKLRYQPLGKVLTPMLQKLQALLPVLAEVDIIAALVALAECALPAQELTAAALSMLASRQLARQQDLSAAEPQEGQQRWQTRPSAQSLALLWAVSCCAAQAPDNGSLAMRGSVVRFLVKLAHEAAELPDQQVAQNPQLLLKQQQVWRMLQRLPQLQRVRRCMYMWGLSTPKTLLWQQLQRMTQLLLADGSNGSSHEQALLQLLFASNQQRRTVMQQRLHAEQQQQGCALLPAQQQQAWQVRQRQSQMMGRLLPLWLEQQLQKQCQQRLAADLATAQRAAGFVPSEVQLKGLWPGELALILQVPQQLQQQQQSNCATCQPDNTGSGPGREVVHSGSSSSYKGVVVVLDTPSSFAVNSGTRLGSAAARDAVLRAAGYLVLSTPVHLWLPDAIKQHQQNLQLQKYVELPGKHQHVQKLVWKRGRRDRTARQQHLQQLMQVLQQVRCTGC